MIGKKLYSVREAHLLSLDLQFNPAQPLQEITRVNMQEWLTFGRLSRDIRFVITADLSTAKQQYHASLSAKT